MRSSGARSLPSRDDGLTPRSGGSTVEAVPRPEVPADVDPEKLEDLLRTILRIPWYWAVGMAAVAVASCLKVTRAPGGDVEVTVEVGTIAIVALALIWLPAVIRLFSTTGGSMKGAGFEAATPGLVGPLTAIRTAVDQLKLADADPRSVAQAIEIEVGQIAAEYVPADQFSEAALEALARSYEQARTALAPGGARTLEMTRIVNEARVRARAAPDAARSHVLRLLGSSAPGDRIMGLALAQEVPTRDALPRILDLVSNSATAFEMYHALLALERLAPSLQETDRQKAIAVVEEAKADPRGVGTMSDRELPGLIVEAIEALKTSR